MNSPQQVFGPVTKDRLEQIARLGTTLTDKAFAAALLEIGDALARIESKQSSYGGVSDGR